MYKRVIKYLDKNNVLFQSQYGFRKKHSTNLATIELRRLETVLLGARRLGSNFSVRLKN